MNYQINTIHTYAKIIYFFNILEQIIMKKI